MDEFDAKTELAETFLRAGNDHRAEEICTEVLAQCHDHLGAFQCLFDVHLERDNFKQALDLCDWRLARCPTCPQTHLCKLVAFGNLCNEDVAYDYVKTMQGERFMATLRPRFENYPFMAARAEIIFSYYFLDAKETLDLIIQERTKGHLDPNWLDQLESSLGMRVGDMVGAEDFLQKRLSENAQDPYALHNLSVIKFFRGRLLSAINYARQAKRVAPERSAESQEVIFFSFLSLLPVFWPGHAVIALSLFLTRNFEDYLAFPSRFLAVVLTCVLYAQIYSLTLGQIGMGDTIQAVLILFFGLWAGYVLFYFGDIGTFFGKRAKSVKLSKKY